MYSSIQSFLTRALFVIALLVAFGYGVSFFKTYQRKSALIADLRVICGESSYFRQFTSEEAEKTLVRAIGLLAEADSLGLDVNRAIESGLGLRELWSIEKTDAEEITPSQQIIRASLRGNYENFIKLGYRADFHTLKAMKAGTLTPLASGPLVGRTPIVKPLIPAAASSGMEKVIANLELSPPDSADAPRTDVQLAAAKQLARDLAIAGIIEEAARDRIIDYFKPENTKQPTAP